MQIYAKKKTERKYEKPEKQRFYLREINELFFKIIV